MPYRMSSMGTLHLLAIVKQCWTPGPLIVKTLDVCVICILFQWCLGFCGSGSLKIFTNGPGLLVREMLKA